MESRHRRWHLKRALVRGRSCNHVTAVNIGNIATDIVDGSSRISRWREVIIPRGGYESAHRLTRSRRGYWVFETSRTVVSAFATLDIGNNSVLVCSIRRASEPVAHVSILSSVWKRKVSNGYTEMMERTLKTCQTLSWSNLQVAIASLLSFAW